MITQDQVSIIIPHLGGTKEAEYSLDQCLRSLEETVPEIKKIIAINGNFICNGQHDVLEPRATNELPENLEVVAMTGQGQCKAVNAAVAMTNTPYIFISNDDMVYAPGWFTALQLCGQGPFVSPDHFYLPVCLSPRLVEPRPGAPTFEVFFAGGAGGDFDKEKWLQYAKDREILTNYKMQTGFNLPLLLDRRLWDTVGGYDINYDPWGSNSDSDLQYKIMLAGVQPEQNPNCVVYHFSQTSGTFEPRNDSHRFKNYAYFKEKWGFDRTDNRIWESDFEIPNEGRIFRPEWEGKYKHGTMNE